MTRRAYRSQKLPPIPALRHARLRVCLRMKLIEYAACWRVRPCVRTALTLALAIVFLSACATKSTIEMRRNERSAAYNALPPEEKALADAGQIKVGMSADAVYIAWGKPAEVLESEDENGHVTSWRYYGSWMQESRYWAYRETSLNGGPDLYLERYLVSDYQPRDYVRAEINFKDGKVASWRTLPKPAY